MSLCDRRVIEWARQAHDDRVIRLTQRPWVPSGRAQHLLAIEQPFGVEEPDGVFILVTGRAHRDGDGDGLLVWPCSSDLKRRFPDNSVFADLERLPADRDDPAARDVAERRRGTPGQACDVVVSRVTRAAAMAVRRQDDMGR